MRNVGLLDVAQQVFANGVPYREAGLPAVVRDQPDRLVDVAVIQLPHEAVAMIFDDVTDERQALAQLEHAATHDGLTGLLNRRALRQALEAALNSGGHFAVLVLDLDGFKAVNDNYGHQVGDELLVTLAGRFTRIASSNPGFEMARLGGDEFAAVVPTAVLSGRGAAAALQAAVAEPVDMGHTVVTVGTSIGVAEHRGGPATASELLRAADLAMYGVKGTKATIAVANNPSATP